MDEKALQFIMNRNARNARAGSVLQKIAGRRMCAGEICDSCRSPLPLPHTPGLKRCAFCAGKHHVRMTFRECFGWRCRFWTKSWEKFPTEVTFKEAAKVREVATRGNGLIDDWDREGFELDLEIGSGGIWLRLSDEQYLALGGVL